MFADFWDRIATPLLITIFTGVIGWIGTQIKNSIERKNEKKLEQEREFESEKTKRQLADDCVRWTEQVHKDLHGAEKFAKCIESLSQMLAEKGIPTTELEMEMLVEAAVQRMNTFKVEDVINVLPLPGETEESLLQDCGDCDITYTEGVAD